MLTLIHSDVILFLLHCNTVSNPRTPALPPDTPPVYLNIQNLYRLSSVTSLNMELCPLTNSSQFITDFLILLLFFIVTKVT